MGRRQRRESRRLIFLSHAQTDAVAARVLKSWLEETLKVEVFVSSDSRNVPMGIDWYNEIDEALKVCTLGIILVTRDSIERRWVSYELGWLRAASKKTAPVCAGGISKTELPSPFDRSQACDYDNEEDRLKLLRSIAGSFGIPEHLIPSAAARDAPKLQFHDRRVKGSADDIQLVNSSSGSSPLQELFKTSDRWTTLIYTCRATFTGEHCPKHRPIQKALWTHVPVDEFQTLCLAANQLIPREARSHEDDILHTVMCSRQAEDEMRVRGPSSHSAALIGKGPPPLVDRDWVIIGENNFSNLLLNMLQVYLPWQSNVGQRIDCHYTGAQHKKAAPVPDVSVRLFPPFNTLLSPSQTREVHRGGGMIAIFPNPFNIRKKVMVLFGCHRPGQFTLENWLRGKEVAKLVELFKNDAEKIKARSWTMQAIVNNAGGSAATMADTRITAAIQNIADNRLYWLKVLNDSALTNDFTINTRRLEAKEIYDLSLVVPLEADDQRLLKSSVCEEVGELSGYWEDTECEIGFHVTLYEFCTHYSLNAAIRNTLSPLGERLFDALSNSPAAERPQTVNLRLRGIEVLPSSLVSYVDFIDEDGRPTDWLNSVRNWCEMQAESLGADLVRSGALNLMRVPFPAHVTLCRFNQDIPETQQVDFKRVAARTRLFELLGAQLSRLSLTVARRSPYKDVSVVGTIDLNG